MSVQCGDPPQRRPTPNSGTITVISLCGVMSCKTSVPTLTVGTSFRRTGKPSSHVSAQHRVLAPLHSQTKRRKKENDVGYEPVTLGEET